MQPELIDVCKRINAYMLRQKLMHNQKNCKLFMFDENGDNISYYAFNKYLKYHAFRVTGKRITPHALRHTHASLLLEKGMSVDAIARRLCHGDSRVTKEIYLHVTDKLKKEDNKTLEKIKIL